MKGSTYFVSLSKSYTIFYNKLTIKNEHFIKKLLNIENNYTMSVHTEVYEQMCIIIAFMFDIRRPT